MRSVGDQWSSLWPALAFLLVGVPLAALLDRLGFFEAAAAAMTGRRADRSVLGLWVLASLTTVVLNLDTTVVLLSPLYLRLARAADADPVPLVVVPLLLASFASSVLPVSNLTNLIVADQFHVTTGDFLSHIALPSIVAVVTGWLVYRRRYPTRLATPVREPADRRALLLGGAIVAGLLIGFVAGPRVGIAPWMTAAAADLVLIGVTRVIPWRDVPLLTAAGVAALAAVIALVATSGSIQHLVTHDRPLALIGIASMAGVIANAVNNLPALLLVVDGADRMSWGMWAWLLGVNTAAVLLPIGALANLLWRRIMRTEGLAIGLRDYARITIPIAVPAFAAAAFTLGLERLARA
jgi:arsenical pump membrane protein